MFETLIILACVMYIASKFIDKKPSRRPNEPWRNEPKVKKRRSLEPVEDLSVHCAKANEVTPPLANVPHKKSSFLATKNERNFYAALTSALPDGYIVHCQTALMALVQPIERRNNSRTWAKRMDFVITDQTTKVIAVIELDDKTHTWESRKKRDQYVNAALEGHHKLIRFKAQMSYNSSEIKAILDNELNLSHSPLSNTG